MDKSWKNMDNRLILADIKRRMLAGQITFEIAKKEAQPVIDQMNKRGKEIAKRFNRRHQPFIFGYLIR